MTSSLRNVRGEFGGNAGAEHLLVVKFFCILFCYCQSQPESTKSCSENRKSFTEEELNNEYKIIDRIDCLRETEAYIKFLSLEPLLGRGSDLDLSGIDWVIVGGESGPGAPNGGCVVCGGVENARVPPSGGSC